MQSQTQRFSAAPLRSLTCLFLVWKLLLTFIVVLSPGQGYDTSTTLLRQALATSDPLADGLPSVMTRFESYAEKLIRWDAIYFTSAAHRGHLFEQEWAFGWGFSKLISLIANTTTDGLSLQSSIWAGLLVANVSHLLSVLLLYRFLTLLVERRNEKTAFIAALLHIISPAGLFLSSPYGESLFSLLNFSGMFVYCACLVSESRSGSRTVWHDLRVISAGVLFGLASTVRSNGLLSGVVFFADFLFDVSHFGIPRNFTTIRRYMALAIAGSITVAGYAAPQTIAFMEYCKSTNGLARRSWCQALPPSIYTFVQKHYWDVGFMKYWTVSNLPLFLLAAPMLYLMLASSASLLIGTHEISLACGKASSNSTEDALTKPSAVSRCIRCCAVPQLILTILTLTSFHVQIITRISSGYPLLYLWTASAAGGKSVAQLSGIPQLSSQWWIRWMVIYAVVQGGLFLSFLPPA